jgi:hypothetical protein
MKHTPGPWTANQGTYGWFIHPLADDLGIDRVAVDVSEADARLIAAAPDYDDAARYAVAALARMMREASPRPEDNGWWQAVTDAYDRLQAAIAKAEGVV